MYIKKLSIKESAPQEKIIREITFKRGMNYIVDNSTKAEGKGNSVGKTTVLRLIDICLGAKERKYIYYGDELGVNTQLKDYIHNNKIFAELEVVSDFASNAKINTFRVELFERGKRYINGGKLSRDAFWKKANEILFNNNNSTPTFRQVIPKFVRIDQKQDNEKFLKFLDIRTPDAVYENIYSFLFSFNDKEISEERLIFKEEIKKYENDLKKFKSLHQFKNINELTQRFLIINKKIETINNRLSNLVNSEKYKLNEKEISEIRLTYTRLVDELDVLKFKKRKIQEILKKAKSDDSLSINKDVLKNLYNDTKDHFSKLHKTFQELLEFNKQLINNKIAYYNSQFKKISNEISSTEEKISSLFEENRDVIMLIEENKLDEYQELQRNLIINSEEKGTLEEKIEIYNSIENITKKLEDDLAQLETNNNIEEVISKFNDYFTKFSNDITNDDFYLYPTGKEFPLAIGSQDTGLSTGTKKSVITAFDLAYQKFSENKIQRPDFIIHDVLETMDKIAFENMIKIVNQIGCQYIVAVLNEKISKYESVKEDDIRLTLSETDKLFRI
ncbi:DUF2326 domain-containing protein [Peribacillus simplex]|uniref:DUF2326 domain-containing protein n=1 Tax=Peribacillus simplex TaxID=1478 RepID=UPI003D28F464